MKWLLMAHLTACAAFVTSGNDEKCPVSANVRGHENIEWSISYAYGLTDSTRGLPRVLLVGDSICNGYQTGVRERLKGKMNVTYWVSSYCVTSPAYLPLLSIYLEEAKYDVIHFNNGLHSLETPTAAYEKGMCRALAFIREKQPDAKIVWCSSTPLTNDVKTAKCRELNAAAAKVVAELGGMATNDLFALCDPLDRAANWGDEFHFRPEAKAKQAEQVAASVLSARDANGPCGGICVNAAESNGYRIVTRDSWYGFNRKVFEFLGQEAWIVEPKAEAEGRPWAWIMEWPDAFAKRTGSVALLKAGYHVVTLRPGHYENGKFVSRPGNMNNRRLRESRTFQKYLVDELQFAPKANLIGMSWGGFYSVRYAGTYPDAVSRIYLDAPLLDFSTAANKESWGLNEKYGVDVKTYVGKDDPRQPVNMYEPIAKAGIPVLLLYGGSDTTVPPSKNCLRFAESFKGAGGTIEIVARKHYGHHPHGLEVDEQQRFVDFFNGTRRAL